MSGRILLAQAPGADDGLAARLSAAYLDPRRVRDAAEAAALALRGDGDLIIAEAGAPGAPGLEVLQALAAASPQVSRPRLPVLLLVPREARQARLAGLRAGADDFAAPDAPEEELLARIRALLRLKVMTDELSLREDTARALGLPADPVPPPAAADSSFDRRVAPGGLLLVCPDGPQARRRAVELGAALRLSVRRVPDGRAALAAAADRTPELVLLDLPVAPAPGDGAVFGGEAADALPRLIPAMRARPGLRDAGLVAVAAEGADAARALDLGADDVAGAPAGETVDSAELAARLRIQLRRKRWSDRLRGLVRDGFVLAATDGLTGLWNRRYAETHLARLCGECRAAAEPLALLMIDLDRFKAINDGHGHAAGDAVLRVFAERLRASVRGADLVARLGGEEFCAALRGVDAEGARHVAERLREAVAGSPFALPCGGGETRVTVSIGVAASDAAAPTL
ncbi:MAG: diguanylate cyclase, partial [Pseudomonadota bacterium]